MKKPFKVLSAMSLAGVFAASSIVPVAAAEAEVNMTIEKVYLENDSKLYEAQYEDYNDASLDGVNFSEVAISVADDVYSLEDFNEASMEAEAEGDTSLANILTILLDRDYYEPLKDFEVNGTFDYIEDEDQWGYIDEQPEDRLNETFFYNVA